MGSFPSAAAELKLPQQQPDMLGEYGKMVQLKSLLAQQQLQQQLAPGQLEEQNQKVQQEKLATQAAQQQQSQTEAINAAYHDALEPDANGVPQINHTTLTKSLASAGHGAAIPSILKNLTDYEKSQAELQETQGKVELAGRNAMGSLGLAIQKSNYDPNLADLAMQQVLSNPNTPAQSKQQLTQMRSAVQQNPSALKQIVDSMVSQSPAALASQKEIAETGKATAEGTKAAQEAALTPQQRAMLQGSEGALAGLAAQGNPQAKAALQALRQFKVSVAGGEEAAKVQGQMSAFANMGGGGVPPAVAGARPNAPQTAPGSAVPVSAAQPAAGAQTSLGPRDESFLGTIKNPAIAAQVKALADGRMQFPGGFALKSPYWQNMIGLVTQYDPSFDAVNYNARAKTRQDFTSGKSAQNINALNTAIGHLDTLSSAAEGLNNRAIPKWNSLANLLESGTGDPRVKKFDTTKQAVADEVTRVWRQAGGSEADIQGWEKQLDSSGSPAQLHAVISQIGDLLQSKLESLQNQYSQGMGINDVKMLTSKSEDTLSRLRQKAGKGSGFDVTDPAGKAHHFDSAEQAANFKRLAGIQ